MAKATANGTHPWFAAFFTFGTLMCALTTILLLFPGTALDRLWRLNPTAQSAFQSIGPWAVAFMVGVGLACACTAIGLRAGTAWGISLAVVILSVNALGDLLNAIVRH